MIVRPLTTRAAGSRMSPQGRKSASAPKMGQLRRSGGSEMGAGRSELRGCTVAEATESARQADEHGIQKASRGVRAGCSEAEARGSSVLRAACIMIDAKPVEHAAWQCTIGVLPRAGNKGRHGHSGASRDPEGRQAGNPGGRPVSADLGCSTIRARSNNKATEWTTGQRE